MAVTLAQAAVLSQDDLQRGVLEVFVQESSVLDRIPLMPIEGNAYAQKYPKSMNLPATLWDAAQRLKASKVARDWFGDAFVDHFAATREWEEREFRRHITDWELARYFEII